MISEGIDMSNNKFKVNIDTVDFNVTGMSFHLPDSTTATVTSSNGELIKEYQNRSAIHNEQDTHSVNVRTETGNKLLVEGSPFAFLYGQNLYTSANLKKGCFRTLVRVCKHFGFKPSKDLQEMWRAGDINLTRADLAVDFKFETDYLVIEALKQIKRQLVEMDTTMKTNRTSVSFSPRNGVKYSITFYAKGPQMRQLKRYKKSPYCKPLGTEAEGVFRIELRLMHSELCELGLDKVSAWKLNTPNEIFSKYFNKLNFLNVTCGELTIDELANIDSKLRPVFAMHKSGVNLSQVYKKRTLQRYQSKFRAKGIDIKCPIALRSRVLFRCLKCYRTTKQSNPPQNGCAKLNWCQQ